MKKRIGSLILTLALCLGLAPWLSGGAQAVVEQNPLYGTVALDSDYGLYGVLFVVNSKHELWAYRSDGTSVVNPVLLMSDVTQICAYEANLAIIKTDGTLWMATFEPLSPVCSITKEFQLATNVKKLTLVRSEGIFLYLTEDGSLYQGFIYFGNTDYEAWIHAELAASNVVDIAGNYYLTADGTVMGQTYNEEYDIEKAGKGDPTYRWIETEDLAAVQGLPPISKLYTAANAYFAIDRDGGLWSWGRNNCGQLGNGGVYDRRPQYNLMLSSPGRSFWQNTYIENTVPTKVMDQVVDVFGMDDYHYDDMDNNGDANRWCTMYARTADGVLWQWADGGGSRQLITYENGNYIFKNNNITMPDAMYLKPRVAPVQDLAYVSDSVRIYQDGRVTASGFRALLNGDEVEMFVDMTRSSYTTELSVCNRGQASSAAQPPVPTAVPNASGFVDVPETGYYYNPVIWAVKNQITTGTSATTFTPGKTCSIAEILTFLYRACGEPPVFGNNPFTDVNERDYFYKAAKWAYSGSVIPENLDLDALPCTRGQAVYFIWWACGAETLSGNTPFRDVPADAFYAPAVSWALKNGVTTGTTDDAFSPDKVCTRGEIVTFLYRALGQ